MRRMAPLLTACSVLLLTAVPARAAFVTGCCACIADHKATESGGRPTILTQALFCTNVVGEGYPDFVMACDGAGGVPVCTDEVQGESCSQTLAAAESISCPASGVPTAGATGLLGLAAALAAAGAWHLRRRRA